MLKLSNIEKTYDLAHHPVHALKGVSIRFRASEFVAILGQSGCGKTTLLNIIGGLDQYTSGDLIIRGRSTRQYKSRDWDTYRNHSVGFVFQSYNLIPHQTVLANVELALTLSGVRKAERRRRATEALTKVGLADQLHKRPNQLSGGQMQRVAIARALVNDPQILLADEPTGALDSETSLQVMEILKEVAKDRLVIMVTHNPELAQQYANRIVRLLDGNIVDDSNPYEAEDEAAPANKKEKHASMSALTAFSLSLSNLLTKKGRTLLTAFAGSIGIIGIALILSLSTGINDYIADVEKETLASYPLSIQSQVIDMSSMMGSMQNDQEQIQMEEGKIYSANVMSSMMNMMISAATDNNLAKFKEFIDSGESGLEQYVSEIRYNYSTPLFVYKSDISSGIFQVNPSSVFKKLGMNGPSAGNIFTQLTANRELLNSQYEVLAGRMPTQWNEVILVVDENNRITDYTLYAMGILDIQQLREALEESVSTGEVKIDTTVQEYTYDDFLGLQFKLLLSTDYFAKENGIWVDKSEDEIFLASQLKDADQITVVGVVRPQGGLTGLSSGVIGYTGELMTQLIKKVEQSEIVQDQKKYPVIDIFSGLPFKDPNEEAPSYTMDELLALIPSLPEEAQIQFQSVIDQMRQAGMSDEYIASVISSYLASAASSATYEGNLRILGVSDLNDPDSIQIYPVDFEAKDRITQIIADYNRAQIEEDQLTYTDYVGLMMSSVTTIINAISYILIAFVGISLVVSSIMIGIITNISVLERTKEIGILRSVGASKKDISRVFNAETFIVGLAAGLVGIGVTELLIIPTNYLIHTVAQIEANAYLNPVAAGILVVISVVLTLIAGLIPSRNAANKDPVVALRTE